MVVVVAAVVEALEAVVEATVAPLAVNTVLSGVSQVVEPGISFGPRTKLPFA